MIKKYKKYVAIAILILFVIAIIDFIYTYISNLLKKPDIITKSDIEQYIVDENLVKNYDTFYVLDKILQEILDEFIYISDSNQKEDVNIETLYNILTEDAKKLYTKDELIEKVDNFILENYIPKTDDDFLITEGMLKKAYVGGAYYILEFENFDRESVYLLVYLAPSQLTYSFSFLEE